MLIPHNAHGLKRSSTLFIAGGIFIIVLGSISISGWFFNKEILASIFEDYISMKLNTALCFVITGISFVLLVKYNTPFLKKVFTGLTICLCLYSLISLSQNVFNYNAGIDELFVKDYRTVVLHQSYPGRMATITSICFILLGLSFLGIDSKKQSYKKTAQAMLHFVSLVSFIAIIGYMLKVPFPVNFHFFSSVALNTAVGFLVISVIASFINYNLGITSLFTGVGIGNIIARKLFPRMILSLVILGYLSIQLERSHTITDEFGVVLSTTFFLLICLYLIWDTLTEMNRLDLKRTEAENETQLLNKNLEDKVLQRTRDLEQSNERFIKILNSSPTGIALTRVDNGHYADVNPAILKMLKYERDELIGHTSAELSIISAEYCQYMIDTLQTKGYIKNEDILLRDKDGNQRHCKISAETLEYNDEKFMMSFVYDVTDLKVVENNLQNAKKDLEILTDKLTNQNKQLLGFAHITSHNIRSPVSNLNLLVHFYKESNSPEDRHDLWGNFETVVHHLNDTLEELLETLKIQEDVAKEREELSFEKTLNYVKSILIGQVMESKAVITADFSKAPDVVYPKMYLESIIMNLVSNSIKYRSPHRIPEITLATDNIDGEIILTIKDNGLGIDMIRHKNSLFGMRKTFHRHAEARGLGLFITKTQIEAMGGEISAGSVVNKGTTFKIIFNKKLA